MTRHKINQSGSGSSRSGGKATTGLGNYGKGKILTPTRRTILFNRSSGSSDSSGSGRRRGGIIKKNPSSSAMETNEINHSGSSSAASSSASPSWSSSLAAAKKGRIVLRIRKTTRPPARKTTRRTPARKTTTRRTPARKTTTRRPPARKTTRRTPTRRTSARKPKLYVETVYNKRAKTKPNLLPYQARLSVQSMDKRYPILGNRIPNLPCRVLQGQCLYRNPRTKKIGKQIVDGSEDKPYIIELKLNTKHPPKKINNANKRKK